MMKLKTIAYLLFILLVGCTNTAKLTDDVSPKEPPIVPMKDSYKVIQYRYDSMVRLGDEYTDQNIVVDPDYYSSNDFGRGDVIYYVNPNADRKPTDNIARIIGRPGESIKIIKGQIYINNKMLSSYYGKAHRGGQDREEYITFFKNHPDQCNPKCVDASLKSYFDLNVEEHIIPDNQIYVVGDNWGRAEDSLLFGPLDTKYILGKVLGYKKE